MLKRISAGLAAGAALSSFVALPAQADINTRSTVRWNSGGAVYTTKLKDFQKFLESDGEITSSTNRALKEGVALSGWTAEEIAKGLSKEYKVDVVYVARFLYSKKGVAFLEGAVGGAGDLAIALKELLEVLQLGGVHSTAAVPTNSGAGVDVCLGGQSNKGGEGSAGSKTGRNALQHGEQSGHVTRNVAVQRKTANHI